MFLHSWCDAGLWGYFVYSRVGKNRDTRRESPAGAGAGRTADHLTVLFSQKVLAVRKANDIYRPVRCSIFILISDYIGTLYFIRFIFWFSILEERQILFL